MNQRALCREFAEDVDNELVKHATALSVAQADAFSYSELIVHKYPHDFRYHGRRVAWMTNRKFSVTTSKHCTFLRSALTQCRFVILNAPNRPEQEDKQSIMRLCDLLDKELAQNA